MNILGDKMECYKDGGCKTCPGREGKDFCQPGNQYCPEEGLKVPLKCDICGALATGVYWDGDVSDFRCNKHPGKIGDEWMSIEDYQKGKIPWILGGK
ncbi:MAG: hypothetical protein PHR47_02765 [Candidatus Pacebacteria bacterium]|nr:hypothetical protein [Candidatus Paceibacterota bacterium]